eukprot:TRINITY_DN83964_c0_g1_i1.p1 TRINITY_DN83964_c0_g1~~TRINITY_DN83964_c0_g1_i1.p1  ORF type:complete len:412 (+),score=27.19 TRINITY_DN83964_c0_g1_i1:108-1343(+)
MEDAVFRYMEATGADYDFARSALKSVCWDLQAALNLAIQDDYHLSPQYYNGQSSDSSDSMRCASLPTETHSTRTSNDWLLHPELMDARVSLSRCMEQMRLNQMWTEELEQIWAKLRDVQEAKPALAEALQLNEQRRNAYTNAVGLLEDQRKLDNEFTVRLQHLNKIAGCVLDGVHLVPPIRVKQDTSSNSKGEASLTKDCAARATGHTFRPRAVSNFQGDDGMPSLTNSRNRRSYSGQTVPCVPLLLQQMVHQQEKRTHRFACGMQSWPQVEELDRAAPQVMTFPTCDTDLNDLRTSRSCKKPQVHPTSIGSLASSSSPNQLCGSQFRRPCHRGDTTCESGRPDPKVLADRSRSEVAVDHAAFTNRVTGKVSNTTVPRTIRVHSLPQLRPSEHLSVAGKRQTETHKHLAKG